MSSNQRMNTDYAGEDQNCRLQLHVAVWLLVKVCVCKLGLWPLVCTPAMMCNTAEMAYVLVAPYIYWAFSTVSFEKQSCVIWKKLLHIACTHWNLHCHPELVRTHIKWVTNARKYGSCMSQSRKQRTLNNAKIIKFSKKLQTWITIK